MTDLKTPLVGYVGRNNSLTSKTRKRENSLPPGRQSPAMVLVVQNEQGGTHMGGYERRLACLLWTNSIQRHLWRFNQTAVDRNREGVSKPI